MKLGFLTRSVDDIVKAARLGFDAVELDVRAFGDAAAGPLAAAHIDRARALCAEHGVSITALAYYDLAFQPPPANAIVPAYERVFDLAETLGVGVIASMSGFDATRDWGGNVERFAAIFGPVAQSAEPRGVRVAFENWMGFWGNCPFAQ